VVDPLLVLMDAVNVTDWLINAGFGPEVRTTEVVEAPTLWLNEVDVLVTKFVSPL
jgi:hypothetical protein